MLYQAITRGAHKSREVSSLKNDCVQRSAKHFTKNNLVLLYQAIACDARTLKNKKPWKLILQGFSKIRGLVFLNCAAGRLPAKR